MKEFITKVLVSRTQKYLAKTNPKVVAITGSVGKTTVTQATATILSEKYSVRTTFANYNTDIGVILTIFGQKIQTNPLAWALIALKIVFLSFGKPKHEVYVLELGTDVPGEIARFAYLKPDYGVITAIAPEHMEFFKDIDAVAKEEFALTSFTKKTIIAESVSDRWVQKYAQGDILKTGAGTNATLSSFKMDTAGSEVTINLSGDVVSFKSEHIAEHLIRGLLAPVLLAKELGLSTEEIKTGLEKIKPLPGRMRVLKGANGSTIIDDTYNASPDAVMRALDVLYAYPAEKKIALLGMMNELGETSEKHHSEIGDYCDPTKLHLVITLGVDANAYTSLAATKKGCRVVTANGALEAGEIIKDELGPSVVVLAKGSQNGVYAEEAVKLLLADVKDAEKLVRQNAYWPAKKKKYFSSIKQQ